MNTRPNNRKALQLCRQVERTLTYVLSDLNDDVLAGLMVQSVQPAPNASRLLVTVCPMDTTADPVKVLTHLHSAAGRLRAEIGSAIHRKRVPELMFRCVPRETSTGA